MIYMSCYTALIQTTRIYILSKYLIGYEKRVTELVGTRCLDVSFAVYCICYTLYCYSGANSSSNEDRFVWCFVFLALLDI